MVKNKGLVAENKGLRDAVAQAHTELKELQSLLEHDEAIDPKKKEHWLIRLTKIMSTLAAETLLDATDEAVE